MDSMSIREAATAQPFKPFTLRMNDGREFYIPHPEFIAVSTLVVFVIDHITNAGISLEPAFIASMQNTQSSPASGNSDS